MGRLFGTSYLVSLCLFMVALSGCTLDINLKDMQPTSLADLNSFPSISKLVGNEGIVRGSPGGEFGSSVALSEDGTILVIGAYNDDTDAAGNDRKENAGAVFVFIRDNDEWIFQQKLVPTGLNARMEGDSFGFRVAISGDTIVVGAQNHDYDANGEDFLESAGAVYVFGHQNGVWVQQQKLVPSGLNSRAGSIAERGGYFGESVAIFGDTIVVGASSQSYDAAGANFVSAAGAAYVFTRSGSGWNQRQKLIASGVNARMSGDSFGDSVAISGDTIVVGSPWHNYNAAGASSVSNAGAAYVFTRSGTVWSQQQKLVGGGVNARNADDYFGRSVAIDGDTLVVGANGQDFDADGTAGSSVTSAGAAYVFTRSGTVWSQQQKLVASGTNARRMLDSFGFKLSIVGDTIVVGAYGQESNEAGVDPFSDAGAAYVFTRSGTLWTQQQKLVGFGVNGRRPDDQFSMGLAMAGDIIVAGANKQDFDADGMNASNDTGAVYVFNLSAGAWTPQAKLADQALTKHRSFDLTPQFGSSVALSEDGNTLVVGAPKESFDENNRGFSDRTGAVYVYTKESNGWKLQQKLVASGPNERIAQDYFGSSVSISGDTIVVGAYVQGYDSNGNNFLTQAGAAYVFVRSGQHWTQQQKLIGEGINGRMATDHFGFSVAISGDTIVVGAYRQGYDANGDNLIGAAGAAYVFTRFGTSWTLQQKLVGEGLNARVSSDVFGFSVAISKETIVVGAPLQSYDTNGDNFLSQAGAAYVFVRTGNVWTQQQKLVGSGVNGRISGDFFSYSVAISDDAIVIGSPLQSYDANGDNFIDKAGAAYVFVRSGNTWTQQQKLVGHGRFIEAQFGGSVALSRDTVVIGCPGDDYDAQGGNFINGAGAAYVFKKPENIWSLQQKLVGSGANGRKSGDTFGTSVAVSDSTMAIGAPGQDYNENGADFAQDAGGVWALNLNLIGY
ncbi:hypothetical protein [Bdellovibrio bacteriovorus]|uniref:hypothetical protein n=1 Tax=Bdellovibrio bacteriovorus TaxID=959 RepID=UPI0035A5B0F2